MPFRVMLAGKIEELSQIKFPVMVSPKLDGVRAYVLGGVLLSRSNKPIPNEWAQKTFRRMESVDGELIVGNPTASDVYRKTESCMMTADAVPSSAFLYAFDQICVERICQPFLERSGMLVRRFDKHTCVKVVPQFRANTLDLLLEYESMFLEQGYEGVMLRSLDGLYKQGRSTLREGYLLKLKRFTDSEAEIISCYEQETNNNPVTVDERGLSKRSTHKANKVGNGMLGGFHVHDIRTGVEFDIGTMDGVTHEDRRLWWKKRKSLSGQIVKYRHQLCGAKDKPRFPVFVGFRSRIDL